MAFLLDTNILLRSVDPTHAMHNDAVTSVAMLLAAEETVYIVPQNISEFWNVCTRPLDKNGMGLTTEQTETEVKSLEALLNLALDDPQIYIIWRALVIKHSVKGINVHDARLVAAMKIHGISHILTFNDKDFRRYEPAIKVMTPPDVLYTY